MKLLNCRRAHMRQCSQALREVVPMRRDSSRHTLLELLVESRKYIVDITRHRNELQMTLLQLKKEQEALKWRKRQVLSNSLAYRVRLGHSAFNYERRGHVQDFVHEVVTFKILNSASFGIRCTVWIQGIWCIKLN
ncbi:hypothetical protein HELRODRAFT_191421 [Helobdella robusta]|uniref:BHLH domain-containing protein n=1 Tax=Helobdella robusta TaxID=6412 RepID=T1FSY9_HELRO|nr:hypothetical protein HELRODRAFT_191421 [Helobdella robusta]ESO05239.1 hypothetical protein HELRODRAFT_191421 [Helobdella robusta]